MGKRSVVLSESYFGEERVGRILLRIAPPVMFAQLIQALYNIVDSYFIGQYSGAGLTALSVIFPVQLIISALAIGTGVGSTPIWRGCTRWAKRLRPTARRARACCWHL